MRIIGTIIVVISTSQNWKILVNKFVVRNSRFVKLPDEQVNSWIFKITYDFQKIFKFKAPFKVKKLGSISRTFLGPKISF